MGVSVSGIRSKSPHGGRQGQAPALPLWRKPGTPCAVAHMGDPGGHPCHPSRDSSSGEPPSPNPLPPPPHEHRRRRKGAPGSLHSCPDVRAGEEGRAGCGEVAVPQGLARANLHPPTPFLLPSTNISAGGRGLLLLLVRLLEQFGEVDEADVLVGLLFDPGVEHDSAERAGDCDLFGAGV